MSKKLFLSLIAVCGFAATETTVLAKEKKVDFKYKTKSADISREFFADIIGNTKGCLYDFAKNFKKQPELFLSGITASVAYYLYKNEVDAKVTEFVFGGKNTADHKKEIVIATAALAAVAYVAKDKINDACFADDEEVELESATKKD